MLTVREVSVAPEEDTGVKMAVIVISKGTHFRVQRIYEGSVCFAAGVRQEDELVTICNMPASKFDSTRGLREFMETKRYPEMKLVFFRDVNVAEGGFHPPTAQVPLLARVPTEAEEQRWSQAEEAEAVRLQDEMSRQTWILNQKRDLLQENGVDSESSNGHGGGGGGRRTGRRRRRRGGFDGVKWVVSGAAVLWVNSFRSRSVCVFVGGCAANSVAAKLLKRALNQPRPAGAERQGLLDPGMPSSHAHMLFFLATYSHVLWRRQRDLAAQEQGSSSSSSSGASPCLRGLDLDWGETEKGW
mmetsp:Transcript_5697/g.9631  ORF Transcript_5697/g.9631 Transcript_5697/m.9631 type:complete len:300 (+) Transcript_5697:121-1020(+)